MVGKAKAIVAKVVDFKLRKNRCNRIGILGYVAGYHEHVPVSSAATDVLTNAARQFVNLIGAGVLAVQFQKVSAFRRGSVCRTEQIFADVSRFVLFVNIVGDNLYLRVVFLAKRKHAVENVV